MVMAKARCIDYNAPAARLAMLIEGKITIKPEDVQNGLYTIPDHWRPAVEAKGNKALHILCHMGGDGSADGVPGDLFIPQAMPWGKAQFTPRQLTQAIQRIGKRCLLPLLARSEAVGAAVEIAQGEEL
jgi:hypothetical protein